MFKSFGKITLGALVAIATLSGCGSNENTKEVAAQTTAIDNTEQIKAIFGQIDDLLDSYEKDSSRRLKREIEEKLDELKNLGADSQKIANLEQEFEKIQGSKNA